MAPQIGEATPDADRSGFAIGPYEIIYPIGQVLHTAADLLRDTTSNLLTRVRLEGVAHYCIAPSPSGWSGDYKALEKTITAESDVLRETLDEQFVLHIQGLVRQLMWAFNLAKDRVINEWTMEILRSNWPERFR